MLKGWSGHFRVLSAHCVTSCKALQIFATKVLPPAIPPPLLFPP